jgi:hypothetical protein
MLPCFLESTRRVVQKKKKYRAVSATTNKFANLKQKVQIVDNIPHFTEKKIEIVPKVKVLSTFLCRITEFLRALF